MATTVFEAAKKLLDQETCFHCYRTEYQARNSMRKCSMCGQTCCLKTCVVESKRNLPDDMLHHHVLETQDNIYICKKFCEPIAVKYWMDSFRSQQLERYEELIAKFLSNNERFLSFYEKPGATEDTNKRKVIRFAQMAEVVASVSGLSMTFQAMKYAYYSHEIVKRIIAGDILNVLSPIMEALAAFDVSGPTGVLRLYYLGCQHVLDIKERPNLEYDGYSSSDVGVISESVPIELMNYVGSYVNSAFWLYGSILPSPHDDNEWSSWYLTRLTKRQGYTVVACNNETTKLPDGSKCPSFALLVRANRNNSMVIESREALLVIRGTSSTMDWSINLDEGAVPFAFYTSKNVKGSDDLESVSGWVHGGMYRGALGIMDSYGMRHYLTLLAREGYDIRVVGHSLGAGTAALIAAELQNGFRLSSEQNLRQRSIEDGRGSDIVGKHRNRLVHGLAYATPACMSEELSRAILEDSVVLNVINVFDPVSRFSRKNVLALAEDIKNFAETADKWKQEDVQAFANYASTGGKANDMSLDTTTPTEQATAQMPEITNGNEDNTTTKSTAAITNMMSSYFSKLTSKITTTMSSSTSDASGSSATTSANTGTATSSNSGPITAATVVAVPVSTNSPTNKATVVATGAVVSASSVNVVQAKAVSQVAKPSSITPTAATVVSSSTVVVSESSVVASNSSGKAVSSVNNTSMESLSTEEENNVSTAITTLEVTGNTTIPLVVPGLVIQLYHNRESSISASLITFEHSSFNKLMILVDRMLSEHKLDTYTNYFRVYKMQYYASNNIPNPPLSIVDYSKSGYQDTNDSQELVVANSPRLRSICDICDSTCEWTCILRSRGIKALATLKCSLCSATVCAFCAPMGDEIASDGYQQNTKLPDRSLVVPSKGWIQPKRVCIHCYLQSYEVL